MSVDNIFLEAAGSTGSTLKTPNSKTPEKSVKFTINGPTIVRQKLEYQTRVPLTIPGTNKPEPEFVLDVLDSDGEPRVFYMNNATLRRELANALSRNGIKGFHQGDEFTVTWERHEEYKGKTRNVYSVVIDHKGGKELESINKLNAGVDQAREQARAAYNSGQQAPQYNQQPPAPQYNAAPSGYPAPPQAPQQGGYPAPPADSNPWG